MISKVVYKYCTDPTKIENYDKAVADTTQVYQCHHRLETHFSDGTKRPNNTYLSHSELIALDMYWHRPPEELILLTEYEHKTLHSKGKKFSPLSGNPKRKVICLETGIVYNSIKEAQIILGLYHISECVNGKRERCGGFHWSFV